MNKRTENTNDVVVGTWNKGRTNSNKGKRLPAEPLTQAEVESLIKACSKRAPTGIRNAALLVTLWRCGLRISEALALCPKDIDVEGGTVRVLHGKGNKARTVGIDANALAFIQRWLDKRTTLRFNGRQTVFCTLDGSPLQASYVRNWLKRAAAKAGIEKRVHAHGLRHTHAVELRQEGTDLLVISRQLGHASAVITNRYLDHIAPQQVVDVIKQREWRMGRAE